MCRWCSQIASDNTECPFNPSRLVSAPPPPSSSPCSRTCPLSPSSLIQHMVYRGVSKQLPVIKIIFISIFNKPFFAPLFSAASHPYIFRNTPCRKNAPPFFHFSSIRKSFSRFLLCRKFLLFLNKYANYSYRRNWNLPVNPVWPCPWFYGGERQIERLATPVLWLSLLTSHHLNFQFPITSLLKSFC